MSSARKRLPSQWAWLRALVLLTVVALAIPASPAPRITTERLPSGVALPYPTRRVFRGFGRCLGKGRHFHEAIDLGGVGPDGGIGTPVRSMVRAKVTMIGEAAKRPKDFGTPYRGKTPVLRGGRRLPPKKALPGYGDVYFFTSRRGKWRSGTLIETVGLEAPLEGHVIRYMHLGAVRPDIAVGDVIEAGEEVGVLGGTGVQTASPHVHIDIRTPDDHAVDVAPLLGLAPTASCGPVREHAEATLEGFVDRTPTGPTPPERWPSGPSDDPTPPIELDPPPSPWRLPSSGVDVAPQVIDVPDCGVVDHVGDGPAVLRTHLHSRRWLELTLKSNGTPKLEVWDATTRERLLPGVKLPIAITDLGKALRLVVGETTDVAFVIAADQPWHLIIQEKCRPKPAPEPEPDPLPTPR